MRREVRHDGCHSDGLASHRGTSPLCRGDLALGPELLDPEFELTLSGGKAYELSETDGPLRAPEDTTDWPRVRLVSGGVERADRWSFAQPRSRFMAVNTLAGGLATVWNAEGHLGVGPMGCGISLTSVSGMRCVRPRRFGAAPLSSDSDRAGLRAALPRACGGDRARGAMLTGSVPVKQ